MMNLNPRTAIIIAIISGVLGGGGTVAVINAISSAPDRAQERGFSELDRLIGEIVRLDVRIEQQSTRITELRNDVRDFAALLAASQGEVAALNARIAELEEQLRARDQVIGALREQLEELRNELDTLRGNS